MQCTAEESIVDFRLFVLAVYNLFLEGKGLNNDNL